MGIVFERSAGKKLNISTGCSLLDSKGVKATDTGLNLDNKAMVEVTDEEVIQYCAKCREHKCRLEDLGGREFNYRVAVYYLEVEEVFQCRKCGEIATLVFRNGKLDPTRKFNQVGDTIYHTTNCGECKRIG